MAKKVILETDIIRKKDKLYCCGTSEDGCITILEVDKSLRSKGISKEKSKKKLMLN